jgi:hypothetical protein
MLLDVSVHDGARLRERSSLRQAEGHLATGGNKAGDYATASALSAHVDQHGQGVALAHHFFQLIPAMLYNPTEGIPPYML